MRRGATAVRVPLMLAFAQAASSVEGLRVDVTAARIRVSGAGTRATPQRPADSH